MRQLISLAVLSAAVGDGARCRAGTEHRRLQEQRRAGRSRRQVRDSRGRLVDESQDQRLRAVRRRAAARSLSNVWSEPSPASVAILMDASGSMATKMARARETATHAGRRAEAGTDEVALCTRSTRRCRKCGRSRTRFTPRRGAWTATKAYGATSLWDAIAETAQKISDRQRRRALVVITDGVDSASKMKPSDVSAIASSLDVPGLYPGDNVCARRRRRAGWRRFADRWQISRRGQAAIRSPFATRRPCWSATEQILTELHHQYIIAFEPGTHTGMASARAASAQAGSVRARAQRIHG